MSDVELITLTDAKRILGYASTKSINNLIDKGLLDSWKLPLRNAHMVNLEQVKSLLKPILVKKGEKQI
jgi:hypothetical protein